MVTILKSDIMILIKKIIRHPYGGWNHFVTQCFANHLDRELELVVHLRHQEIMAQSLPHLHDSHNGSINLILTILKDPFCGTGLLLHLKKKQLVKRIPLKGLEMRKIIQGDIYTVSFIWIWFILILKSLCLKSSLQENLSPSSTSLLFGILVRTRAFPQASDCRVRRSSLSSANQHSSGSLDQYCCIMSSWHPLLLRQRAATLTLMWSYRPIPVASLISSRVNSSPSLNISSTSVWKSDTCSSFLPFN